jgi:Family of unknown function (DUF6941)
VKVTMMLADAAQEVGGKLYILGGGWSVTGPAPTPMAIALKLEVPWDRTNVRHALLLELLDEDGSAVLVQDEKGEQVALQVTGEFEAGRPPGLKPGTPIDSALAVGFGPLPLEPGRRYQWRLSIDGETDEDWTLGFSTRPAEPV